MVGEGKMHLLRVMPYPPSTLGWKGLTKYCEIGAGTMVCFNQRLWNYVLVSFGLLLPWISIKSYSRYFHSTCKLFLTVVDVFLAKPDLVVCYCMILLLFSRHRTGKLWKKDNRRYQWKWCIWVLVSVVVGFHLHKKVHTLSEWFEKSLGVSVSSVDFGIWDNFCLWFSKLLGSVAWMSLRH